MFCIAIVRSTDGLLDGITDGITEGATRTLNDSILPKCYVLLSRKAQFNPRNKDVFSKYKPEVTKYLSESPEEKTMNRDELCGKLILSWNIIKATYVFLITANGLLARMSAILI